MSKMTTPIVDFVKKYAENNAVRLHMPGHKGESILGVEKYDITEIEGADVLYSAKGIIAQSEQNAARLFGTEKTLYSTEGSSLSIRAMLYLIKLYAIKSGLKLKIAAGRNAHKTFVTACGLLDIEVDWLLPENNENIISCEISPAFLEDYLSKCDVKPVAVYITSPDYLGNMADTYELSRVCKKHRVLLIVDNAHGAYLRFLENSLHPIDLGADICCDSAHKTLPVLTGGGYLHISKSALPFFAENAERAMALFASTSPSYLILQSLDVANDYILGEYKSALSELIENVNQLKGKLLNKGFKLIGNEPLKLTVAPKTCGYTGYEIADILAKQNIICEFCDRDYVVMMFTPQIKKSELERIAEVFSKIEKCALIDELPPCPVLRERRLSLAKAINLPCVEFDISDCEGKIAASPSVNCPPAVPIVICGEVIDQNAIESFKYYGIDKCIVIDEDYL